MTGRLPPKMKGRGTTSKVDGRFLDWQREVVDDGWGSDEEAQSLPTTVTVEHPKTIITHNKSPDIPFEASINPYRGCETGCAYCFARPTHAFHDLSPGIDFETKLFVKPDAAKLLRKEISKPGYKCVPIAMGTNTDPYQPIESKWRVTREIIEVLHETAHPLSIVTKHARIERDLDLLVPMARNGLVHVYFSITTLRQDLARRLEPRAVAPLRRVEALRALNAAGIPAGVLFAPVIPFINDEELEAVLEASAGAGAKSAGYVIVRLPHEIKGLFKDWLAQHEPLKAERVMSAIRDIRGGRENDPEFFSRQRGTGVFAELIRKRFDTTCKRLGLNQERNGDLRTDLFRPPKQQRPQLDMF